MSESLKLHIHLQKPPVNVHYALQKGHGHKYAITQAQVSALDDLHFELDIEIKGNRQKDELPEFGGPFVQGVPLNKFIYIGIGAFAGQDSAWNRRLKVPLTGITWHLIDGAIAGLETFVPGTGKDGSPACATVKPFAGWHAKR
ncbi:DUF5990 family protein [Mucilaginibacter xinganensis]|uniref:Uncharacterized protein n=1 Tax=Mucilaginibacter xinganensis TaxID=1234841 RepID=A0A223NR90_9SPHI|nr:DUF5990 family protein [Mucilaginibacter xinganensis]ASU32425.1 hypothetical protein MuYL_0522 [Mucilaginibacter xinganensis]